NPTISVAGMRWLLPSPDPQDAGFAAAGRPSESTDHTRPRFPASAASAEMLGERALDGVAAAPDAREFTVPETGRAAGPMTSAAEVMVEVGAPARLTMGALSPAPG